MSHSYALRIAIIFTEYIGHRDADIPGTVSTPPLVLSRDRLPLSSVPVVSVGAGRAFPGTVVVRVMGPARDVRVARPGGVVVMGIGMVVMVPAGRAGRVVNRPRRNDLLGVVVSLVGLVREAHFCGVVCL
jgi:hypothetical protein